MKLKTKRVSEVLKWNEVNLFAELDGREQSKSMNANGMKAKSGWAPRQRGAEQGSRPRTTKEEKTARLAWLLWGLWAGGHLRS